MRILGLACYYHDASACLIEDGQILAAAAEERFSRIQHDNQFPAGAIDFCLRQGNCALNEVDAVVFYEKPIIKLERLFQQHLVHFPSSWPVFKQTMPSWFAKANLKKTLQTQLQYQGPVLFVPHHLSHAASSFLLSGFSQAAIINIDGVGEWATTTIGFANNQQITLDQEIRFPDSLGLLYSTITAYLGFSVNDSEYKVMGLASYGNPQRFLSQFKKLLHQYPDGSFKLNPEYFAYSYSFQMASAKMASLFGFPPRKPESELLSHHQDLAAALQAVLETTVFQLMTHASKTYRTPNLCYAGGVALNSVLNGKIVSKTPFRHLYIPPDPGDGGGAMGAALYASWRLTHHRPHPNFTPYLGPSFPSYQIGPILDSHHLKYRFIPDDSKLLDLVSDYLIRQKVIGWFQGRMEWGPRALGSRSILAAANQAKMKDIINTKVKKREEFRPFAPVILSSHIDHYFQAKNQPECLGLYMLTVLPFTKEGIKAVPATVHVNGTGRPQYLRRADNPLYHDLVKAYYQKTGIPAIINTSFNVRGEPIVCTPDDALHCFLNTEIDYLVIGNYVVGK